MQRHGPSELAGLLGEAAERSRLSVRERIARLRAVWRPLVQTALATAIAWMIATEVAGHPRPFFAPIAAIVTVGVSLGQRTRRAIEIAVGVTVGIAVADLIVLLIGSGTWQLVVVVLLAMVTAILLGSGTLLVTQAGASAALVVTLQPPDETGITFARSLDAAIGAGTALLVSLLVLPVNTLRLIRESAEPVLRELAETLEDVADALKDRSEPATEAALLRARAIDDDLERFREAIDVGREGAMTAMPRRSTRDQLALYATAVAHIDLAVRNTRVLARGALRAVQTGDATPSGVSLALRELAEAVRALGLVLADPSRDVDVVDPAVRAAGHATIVLEDTANLSVSVIVGQIRSTATDLLRSTGLSRAEAHRLIRAAASGG
jgi:uncharacterized membrane protein YgaE (UPF0421/DUF939 family)